MLNCTRVLNYRNFNHRIKIISKTFIIANPADEATRIKKIEYTKNWFYIKVNNKIKKIYIYYLLFHDNLQDKRRVVRKIFNRGEG